VLTVLFATRNGAKTLGGVLEAYRGLVPPRGGWKVVIVDNGSTDASRQIIAGFERHLPLTYVFEAEPGKNAALNAGLASVSGDLVVLTDDDAFPRRDWLVRLREAADANPTFGIFGGVVVPRWQTDPPTWILNWVPIDSTYTVSDPNLTEGPIMDGYHVFGPNMAVRTRIFDAGHRFDRSIGPTNSRSYAMGSETEFVLRLMGQGVRVWYVPMAIVEHFVRTAQMRASWIIGRAMRLGRCQWRLHLQLPPHAQIVWGAQWPPDRPRLLGFPVSLLYQLVRKTGAVALALLRFNQQKLFRTAWALSYVYGYTREAGARRGPPPLKIEDRPNFSQPASRL
jgi:glycosyltransferase involved in cell wall biosynthesis